MPRWLRWTGRVAAGLVLLVVLVVAAVYAVTTRHIGRTYRFPDSPVRAAGDSASLARGRHLVEAVGKCQECHAADLGGELWVDEPAFGRLAGSNLTPGRGGIGDFTDADLERALRRGVGRDGQPLIFMPAEAFTALSDEDLAAIIGYLRTVPPVDREMPAPKVGPGSEGALPARQLPPASGHDDRPSGPPSRSGAGSDGGIRGVPGDDRRMPRLPWPGTGR